MYRKILDEWPLSVGADAKTIFVIIAGFSISSQVEQSKSMIPTEEISLHAIPPKPSFN